MLLLTRHVAMIVDRFISVPFHCRCRLLVRSARLVGRNDNSNPLDALASLVGPLRPLPNLR